MEMNYYHEMTNYIDKMIDRSELEKKYIFLFGHCEASEQMLTYLKTKGYTITGILDNNVNKHGNRAMGVMIYSADYILEYKADETVVLIASRAFEAMKAILLQKGYRGHIVKVVDYNTFVEYSLSEETYKRKYERVQRGMSTLVKIKEENDGEFLFICPYNALGDVYYAMAYLPYYVEKTGINKYSIVVVGEGCKKVAEMFTRKKIHILAIDEMDELLQAVVYTEDDKTLIVHHDRPYTNDMTRFINVGNISFRDMYCCGVYGLPKGTLPTKPLYCKPFQNIDLLDERKSVIISSDAKSVVGIPSEFWTDIIKEYKKNGFSVYTNVVKNEKPLEDTIPISIPIGEMISAVEYAGYFIGIRSGLCDIIMTANCEKIVIFPDVHYSITNVKVYDFFKLEGWKSINVKIG